MSTRHLMAVEFFKLRKRMMTWVVTLLTVGLIVLLYSVLWSISGRAGSFRDDQGFRIAYSELRRGLFLEAGVPFALQIVATFGTLLAIILAAGAAGSEYAWGTVRLMATASSGRLRLITARFIVVWCIIAGLTVLAVVIAMGYSAVITEYYGGATFDFMTAGWFKDQGLALGRTLFVMTPYIALAFAAAVVGRSTLAGVGAGLGVAFLEPLISGLMRIGGGRWEQVPNYLISANRNVVLIQNKLPRGLPTFGPSARDLQERGSNSVEEASVILALYIVAFLALAFVVYRRRDITSGTNA